MQDNLNIHSKASLYEAFPAAEARRLVERFEWHYTPKHGSWLDLAESELGVLSSQCLVRVGSLSSYYRGNPFVGEYFTRKDNPQNCPSSKPLIVAVAAFGRAKGL